MSSTIKFDYEGTGREIRLIVRTGLFVCTVDGKPASGHAVILVPANVLTE